MERNYFPFLPSFRGWMCGIGHSENGKPDNPNRCALHTQWILPFLFFFFFFFLIQNVFPLYFVLFPPFHFRRIAEGTFLHEREREPFSCILYSEGNDFLFVSFGDFDSFLLLRVHLLPFWIFSTLRLSTTTIEGKDTKLNKKKVARLL